MRRLLLNSINMPVHVSCPALFGERTPVLCTLAGVEPGGLWLEGEAVMKAVFEDAEEAASTTIFVPFAQIAYVVADPPPTAAAASPQQAAPDGSARRRGGSGRNRSRPSPNA